VSINVDVLRKYDVVRYYYTVICNSRYQNGVPHVEKKAEWYDNEKRHMRAMGGQPWLSLLVR